MNSFVGPGMPCHITALGDEHEREEKPQSEIDEAIDELALRCLEGDSTKGYSRDTHTFVDVVEDELVNDLNFINTLRRLALNPSDQALSERLAEIVKDANRKESESIYNYHH